MRSNNSLLYLYMSNEQNGQKMKTNVKSLIRKDIKKTGSHFGTVKRMLESIGEDPEMYREFINDEISKKFKSVKTTIRASVRYQ